MGYIYILLDIDDLEEMERLMKLGEAGEEELEKYIKVSLEEETIG